MQALQFVNGQVISPNTFYGCDYLSMLGLNIIHVSKRCPMFVYNIQK